MWFHLANNLTIVLGLITYKTDEFLHIKQIVAYRICCKIVFIQKKNFQELFKVALI